MSESGGKISSQAGQGFASVDLERALSLDFPTARNKRRDFAFETGSARLVAQLSEKHPQIAGIGYGKDHVLQVYVTNEGSNLQLMSEINSRAEFKSIKRKSIELVRVKHSFRKLGHIKQLLKKELSGIEWSGLGYDFARNAVILSVVSSSDHEKAEHLIGKLRIRDAIRLEIIPLAESMGDLGLTPGTINATVQPTYLVSGLQTVDDANKACTQGWNATISEYQPNTGTAELIRGFLTNSHCTNALFSKPSSPDRFYHINVLHQIGTEYVDPAPLGQDYYACNGTNLRCRWSDSAFIRWSGEGLTKSTPEQTVVQTTYNDYTTGSLEIYDPEDTLAFESGYAVQGDWISKMGRTTGWTIGEVLNTCTDVPVDSNKDGLADFIALCSVQSNLGIASGDSGGPAWTSNGSLGLNFAGGGGVAYTSPFQNINDDMSQDGLHDLYSY